MRILKLALISFFFLFLVVFIISLFIPSHVRISKAINLPGGSRAEVWSLVRDTAQWKRWHPIYTNGTLSSNIVPIRVIGRTDSDSATVMTWQQGDRDPLSTGWQVYHPDADSLTLQWYMDFQLGWAPWKKFGSLFFENTYGTMMQQGLENIKKEVER